MQLISAGTGLPALLLLLLFLTHHPRFPEGAAALGGGGGEEGGSVTAQDQLSCEGAQLPWNPATLKPSAPSIPGRTGSALGTLLLGPLSVTLNPFTLGWFPFVKQMTANFLLLPTSAFQDIMLVA